MNPCTEAHRMSVRPELVEASRHAAVYLIALEAFALGMASYVTAGLIPLIESAFAVPVAAAAQLVTAFTLAYGLGSPVVVALLPVQHQRAALLVALGIFVLANVASALVSHFAWLLAFRALAGIGSGVYLAAGIAAVATLSPSRRGRAIAVVMAGMASGTVLGVPLGLLLAERLGWASAFWSVAAFGALALAGLAGRLPSLPAPDSVAFRRKLRLLADVRVVTILLVSLCAAIASLGMYTFIAPFLAAPEYGGVRSVTPYLWVWGIGGVLGSVLIGPIVDRVPGPVVTLLIMLMLTVALLSVPFTAAWHVSVALVPIAVWGAVGWALQVPQNNDLIHTREPHGDGNLAVALNESVLYLGSAIGAAGGGLMLLLHWPSWTLPVMAAAVAGTGALLQILVVTRLRR